MLIQLTPTEVNLLRKKLMPKAERVARDILRKLQLAEDRTTAAAAARGYVDPRDLVRTATGLRTSRQRCAERHAFFAARSPGDKIAWGIGRSGTIQKIEDDYVTLLDDGWPADPPLIIYRAPFAVRLEINILVDLALVAKTSAA
jgi:hypothetical protein